MKLLKSRIPLEKVSSFGIKNIKRNTRCILCRGSKLLCGKTACPILVRFYSQMKTKPLVDKRKLEGSSPPSIFVGRMGWPKVYIGPLVPPIHGDTSVLDAPEFWVDKSIEEIVDFRSGLIRGKFRVHVRDVNAENKIIDYVRELALSKKPVDAQVEFLKKPSMALISDSNVQPFGPSAPLKDMNISNTRTDQRIEKVHYDTDLKALEAVLWLYKKGIFISKIQRAFSAGLLGIEKNRCFVPTKWSITAVDDIISKNLREKVKAFPVINEYRVYYHEALDNRWIVLMIPDYWSYELIEAWYPGTTWNPSSKEIAIYSSSESFKGRTTYAEIGGCFYASRVACTEKLFRERRQATVIVLREIHPGYILPVGVWNVRENVRATLRKKPLKFNEIEDALNYISTKLDIPLEEWIKNSDLLWNILHQKKLSSFLNNTSSRSSFGLSRFLVT
jgi:hypothetical protein